MAAFYNKDGIEISVYDYNTLRLKLVDIREERDTGFIRLPSLFVTEPNEKFRFYVVHNYSETSDQNDLGIWVYSFDPLFNINIQGCKFSLVKGLNKIEVPLTAVTDSYVGVYRSPCYELVNNEAILNVLIRFPKMTFKTLNVNFHHRDGRNKSIIECFKNEKKLKEVRLDNELITAYQNAMKEENYDIYFVVDDKKIGTFKFPLCAVSDVFKAALKDYTKECQTGNIEIEDFDYETVKIFVDALHTHKIYFDNDAMKTINIKMIANKYNVAAIEKAALDAFDVQDVNKDNFVEVYRQAALDDQLIELLAKRFIEMEVDIKELSDYSKFDLMMQVQLLRSVHLKFLGK